MKKRMLSVLLVLTLLLTSAAPAWAKSAVMLHDWDKITSIAELDREDATLPKPPRITNAAGLTLGDKKYIYVTQGLDDNNKTQSLIVYDITELPVIKKVEKYTDISTKILADTIAVKDGYLFAAEMTDGASELMYYPIESDGRLGAGAKIADGRSGFTSLKIVDDYLFYAEQNPGGSCRVYDVSDIAGGVRELGATQTGYGVFAPGIEKISDSLYRMYCLTRTDILVDGVKQGKDGYQYTINDMQVNPDGTVSFTTQFQGIEGFENATNISVCKVNEVIGEGQVFVGLWENVQNKYARYIVDASDPQNPVIQEVETGRALSARNLTEDYYAVGEHQVIKIIAKSDGRTMKEISGLGGQVYGLTMYDGKLLISAEGKLHIYDLYAEVSADMEELGEINDGIVRIDAAVQMTADDRAVLELFGEQIDVTDMLENGRLSYEQTTAAADGEYTAKLSIMRGETELLAEEQTFTLRKTRPAVITNSGLTPGTGEVSGTVRNTHTTDTQAGTLYLAVYAADGAMQKAYAHPISALAADAEETYSFTLEQEIADGQIVKMFAVDESGKALSDVTATGDQSFNTQSDKIPVAIDGRVNIFAEIDPASAVVQISGKSAEEAKQDVFIAVYKPAPDDTELDYVNVFESNADGSFYCAYPMVSGEEGKNYTIFAAMTGAGVLSGTRSVSYYSAETIQAALAAMENATADTFDAIAISEDAQYKNVYGLNTETYNQLEEPYQKAVAAAIAGKAYADIAALNTAFDEQVSKQKAIMDQDHAVKAALEQINTASAGNMEAILEANTDVLELQFGALYGELTEAMKLKLYENWLCKKSFTTKEAVSEAIRQGTAVEYVRQAQYGAVVADQIIQKHGAEMGLRTQSMTEYAALDTTGQQSVIEKFLEKDPQTYAALATAFDAALQEYKNPKPGGGGGSGSSGSGGSSGGGSGSGGGGGISLPIFAGGGPAEEIKPEDVIPDEVLDLEKNNPFQDVSFDAWYFEAVCALAEKKIVEGITDTEFMPDVNVKREEFVKMIVSAYGAVDYTAEAPFADVEKNRWYYSYVATAHKLKLVNGVSEDLFGTGLDITREDLAKLVYDAMRTMGAEISPADPAGYADMDTVSGYAAEAVSALSAAGILTGFEDNTFRPKEQVTRAMAAQVIYSILNY